MELRDWLSAGRMGPRWKYSSTYDQKFIFAILDIYIEVAGEI